MKKQYLTAIAFLMLISSTIVGQKINNNQPELDSGTIESQFDYILSKSTRWKEFQLIRKTSLLKVKEHSIDSLKTIHNKFVSAKQLSSQLESKINGLKKEVDELKNEIQTISEIKDNIGFFGIRLSKSKYTLIVWSFISILIFLLVVILIKFKSNQLTTKTTKNELSKIENEFESYRKKSLRKEQEIMRKLQDEINKNSY